MNKAWDAIRWWEVRRLPFNAVVGVLGVGTVAAVETIGATLVKAGEDVIEPTLLVAGVVFFGIGANAAYTLGWITELLWSGGDTARTRPYRARIFWLGLAASASVTLAPAVLACAAWILIRLLSAGGRP